MEPVVDNDYTQGRTPILPQRAFHGLGEKRAVIEAGDGDCDVVVQRETFKPLAIECARMATTAEVYEYWQAQIFRNRACLVTWPVPLKAYYAEIEAARYRLEPFIRDFAEFDRWRGRRILELGVGAATDFLNFARAGAHVHGIDLTPAAVEHAKRRLELEGLREGDCTDGQRRVRFRTPTTPSISCTPGASFTTPSTPPKAGAGSPSCRWRPGRAGSGDAAMDAAWAWVAYMLWRTSRLTCWPPIAVAVAVSWPPTWKARVLSAYTRGELEMLFSGAGFEQIRVTGFPTPYDRKVAGPVSARAVRIGLVSRGVRHVTRAATRSPTASTST